MLSYSIPRLKSLIRKKLAPPRSRNAREHRKILIMLAFFSISVGLWENFRQLWLEDNGFTASDVSNITGIATFISIIGVVLAGFHLKTRHLKTFMIAVLGVKFINLLVFMELNYSVDFLFIDFCMLVDILTSYLILTSIYPLITTVAKSNRVYSSRKLVEYLFRDVGVLVGSVLIGQHLFNFGVSYNDCLFVSMLFLAAAIFTMFEINIRPTTKEPAHKAAIIKHVLKSRLQVCYMIYAFLAATSFATALGLKMLVLTNYLNFSAGTATNYLLIVGFLSDLVGIVALRYFTPKNDYITITLKFGIRLIAYLMAIIANDPFVFLLAITWSILISTAYEDVSDGYYINLIDNRHQLSYNTVKHVMTYLGEAVGIILCGAMYDLGLPYILGLSAFIMVFQMGFAYYIIYLRHRSHRRRHSASRSRYNEDIL